MRTYIWRFHDDSPEERYVLEDGVTTDLPKHTGPKLKRQILCKDKSEVPAKALKKGLVLNQTTRTDKQPEPSENVDGAIQMESMSAEANNTDLVTSLSSMEPVQQMGYANISRPTVETPNDHIGDAGIHFLDQILPFLSQSKPGNSFPERESTTERTWSNFVPLVPESYPSEATLDEFLQTQTQGMLSYQNVLNSVKCNTLIFSGYESATERTWSNLVPPGPESFPSEATLDEFLRNQTQGMINYQNVLNSATL